MLRMIPTPVQQISAASEKDSTVKKRCKIYRRGDKVGESRYRPVVARCSRSVKRVMYALFFDIDGMVARVAVPERDIVTGTFCRDNVLIIKVNHYITRRIKLQENLGVEN
jgi:hypothetical protein